MASRSGVGRDEFDTTVGDEPETAIDDQVRTLIDDRATEIEQRIGELEAELEQLDNFARITLKERRIAENNGNIAKVSDTLSGFAENTTDKLNALRSKQEENRLLLAAIVEALEDAEGVDVDLSDVRSRREGQLTSVAADDRLDEALDG